MLASAATFVLSTVTVEASGSVTVTDALVMVAEVPDCNGFVGVSMSEAGWAAWSSAASPRRARSPYTGGVRQRVICVAVSTTLSR